MSPHKTVRAMRLGGKIYYIVYGNQDMEALNRGNPGPDVMAASLDGRLVFLQSQTDSG